MLSIVSNISVQLQWAKNPAQERLKPGTSRGVGRKTEFKRYPPEGYYRNYTWLSRTKLSSVVRYASLCVAEFGNY